jgi:hypothetical protein
MKRTDRQVANVLRWRSEGLARDGNLDALLLRDAADALERAHERVAELERETQIQHAVVAAPLFNGRWEVGLPRTR